jgi:hypothetical protein
MSDTHAPSTASPFTESDWEGFRSQDYAAGAAVVTLIISIFCLGVVIYSIVAWSCWK